MFDIGRVSECQLALGDDSFRLRLEITRSRRVRSTFRANVWRAELYRIQPTLPRERGRPAHEPSDELVWVSWSDILRRYGEPYSASSVDKAEALVLAELRAWVRHARGECGGEPHMWAECQSEGRASQNKRMQRTSRAARRVAARR